jgi:CRISPR-associated exonuclease Cas4
MKISGTHLNYYQVCHRKLWLFASGMQMEHTSDTVAEGKLIGQTTYSDRTERYSQLELSALLTEHVTGVAKIDFFDAPNKVIHETKKSSKIEAAHLAQVRFYQYLFEKNGMIGVSAVLEYPKIRQIQTVNPLTDEDRLEVQAWIEEANKVIAAKACPPRLKKSFCKSCSYFDFCWTE